MEKSEQQNSETQQCRNCGRDVPAEDFPNKDSDICDDCYQIKADLIYERGRDEKYS